MKYTTKDQQDIRDVAQSFLNSLKPGDQACVVALEGDLGTGKTAFAQAMGDVLGVAEQMHSPTFVIEKIYRINWNGFKNLIHIDAYRIEKDSEMITLGWEEFTKKSENLILIEWPKNISGLIPKEAKRISFEFINDVTREVEIHE